MELRPYQAALIDRARDELKTVRRTLLVAPTGSGKTVMFSYIAGRVSGRQKRVGIFAHREELIGQIARTLNDFSVPHGIIAAGSPPNPTQHVQVCSAQTYAKRLDRVPRFDLIIVDEAHHCVGGSTWAKCIEHSPDALVLGVTATPERLDGRGLGDMFDSMVMGPTVSELIDCGALCRYRYFSPSTVSADGVATVGGDYNRGQLAAVVDKPAITGDIVHHYQTLTPGLRAVAFCVSIQHAAHVAETFSAAGIAAASIDGKMTRDERRQRVQDFREGRLKVLASCDLISEGFDCPGIEAALLLRPTKSLALYLQQVGRALRPLPGKDAAVILDHVGNYERHGLPDDPRDWSLDGRKARKAASEPVEGCRRCPHCFAVSSIGARSCVDCGRPFPIKTRMVAERAGELEEVDQGQHKARLPEVLARLREQGRARSFEELVAVGKGRNMKNPEGWARHIMQARAQKRVG